MPYGQKERVSYCFHCMEVLKGSGMVCPHCGRERGTVRENARTLIPGTILENKYLIGEIVGEGGFGITYIGLDLNLHLRVAIKEYFPASFASRNTSIGADNSIHVIKGEAESFYQKGLEDYGREANRLAQFASLPGIVSVLNFFYENNTAYMVMDFVEGITLKEYLRRNGEKLPWRKTLELLHPIILSLIEVHKAGIIHRDISPDNIMFSKDGRMVLIDFGAARKVDGNQKKTVILKKGYAPLEQYQTDGNQGVWSDVYSFCATIYRIVGGVKVPDALEVASGSSRIIPLKELARDIPADIDRVIKQGLKSDISARIQNMEELEGYLYKGRRVKNKADNKKIRVAVLALTVVLSFVMTAWSIIKYRLEEEIYPEEMITLTDRGDAKADENYAEMEDILDSEMETEAYAGKREEKKVEETEYESLTDTQELTYEEIWDGLVITGVDYSVTEVVIPKEINGRQVKELRSMSPNAIKVVIKSGTERITAGTFRNCVYLEFVYIPASVTTIDDNAFEHCPLLHDITVSEDNRNFYSEDGKLYRRDGTLLFG